MHNRIVGKWLTVVCGFGLIWGVTPALLQAGQIYQHHITVFGNTPKASNPNQAMNPGEEADIRRLMELVRMKETITRMMTRMENAMTPLLLRALPPGPYRAQLVSLFIERFNSKTTPEHLLDLAVPVYSEYFSDAEIKGLIQFYQSPLGKKWVSMQPKVEAGILPAARSWGRETGRETMLEILQEHPRLAHELRAAQRAAHHH